MADRFKSNPIVFVVDDDADVREALKDVLASVGLRSATFGSTAEFLNSPPPDEVSCLILDVRLPGLGGLDLQAELAASKVNIPIIFITGHGDIPMTVRAMKAGAVEFLAKPFRDQDLLDAVQVALERDRVRWERERETRDLRRLFEALSPRKRRIMALVTAGLMNKQVAAEIGISEVTVKVHRHNIMKKLGAPARIVAEAWTADLTLKRKSSGNDDQMEIAGQGRIDDRVRSKRVPMTTVKAGLNCPESSPKQF